MAAGCTEAEAAARAALVDVESYAVFLDLAADPDSVRSRTEIRFLSRQPGASTFADLSVPASAVSRVIFNGAALDPITALSDGRLQLPGMAERNVLAVEAEIGYSRDGRGLSRFSDPADGAAYVLCNCFPAAASSVFCCFDQPDLRADITLEVTAPPGWNCAASGTVAARPAGGAAGVWRFAAVPVMKPYELTLCAGPYVTVAEEDHRGGGGPVQVSVRCRGTLAGSGGLARIAGVVRQSLAFYQRLLGVPCPYDKDDVVFAPELGPAAMQLPGVTVVSEDLLQRAADPADEFVPLVLAHEVAHLWFGCLVEGRWWDDLWLAEALATYLSYLACDEVLGLDWPWAEFGMQGQSGAYRADSLPGTQPVSSPVDSAADALTRPAAITYSKGASVIRQLAALIGDDALLAGLRDYLTRYGGATATLADLVGCWSAASGRDLSGWADQWLRTAGVNTLRPELTLSADGTIETLAVVQEPPRYSAGQDAAGSQGMLRTHRAAVGVYQREGARLRRRRAVAAEISGSRTVVPELAGAPAPDALVVNDGDLTFARIRFDDRSFRALAECAMDVGDPQTEAVCWTAAWDMTTAAELSVAGFTDLVARRIGTGGPPAGVAELLARAVTGADYYAVPAQRPGLRQRMAAAALDGAGRARPGSRAQRALAAGFAASAQSQSQLGLLRSWLNGTALPDGVSVEPELRRQILAALSARGLAGDDDLDALAAGDPVGGEAHRATCRALRPDPAAKDAAWTAAIVGERAPHMALAHAQGIWVPGQERILAACRDRYFTEALPAVGDRDNRTAQRLARLLYPATMVVLEQRAILQQVIGARAAARSG